MSKDLDNYANNLAALDSALRDARIDGIMSQLDVPVGEFLKMLARSNVGLSAKCIRPVEQP